MTYNWQRKDWPNFKYDLETLQPLFMEFALDWAELKGMEKGLSKDLEEETLLNIMVSEAIKSSAIEGEFYSREDVMSSIKNKLGLSKTSLMVKDRYAAGISELMVIVRKSFQDPLSLDMLKTWHTTLFAYSKNLLVGDWRSGKEPMQIVSGPLGREQVHFEAPPSDRVPKEMERFVEWYNQGNLLTNDSQASALLKSAIAHLYFESIHPFEDGNGRIGRAIAEKALSQGLNKPILLSISKFIETDKNSYYQALKDAQGTLEITNWIKYFVKVIIAAQLDSKVLVWFLLKKAKFFDQYRELLEARHTKVLGKMFDAGPEGFKGGMSAKKYMSITKLSKSTATRDLQYLHQHGILIQKGAGRSVWYELNLEG
ncbi:cell filamentation protein Fic [Rhodonellum psychrophilum GCM71 = DSM 17998]|uniref:Cell filamentation protein Fic n=2 Tax=Rhodonellum TaxID=336827 RepID=U5BLN0_9BACT|nr:cell filamentation protein Fic [Rhodonellum psychrophilum GCM71 = DSM 17998]